MFVQSLLLLVLLVTCGILATHHRNQYVAQLLSNFPYKANKNVVFSPLGIKMSLLLLAIGGDANQAEQISRFLFEKPNEDQRLAMADLVNEAQSVVKHFHHPPGIGHDGVDKNNHNYLYTFLFMNGLPSNQSALKVLKSMERDMALVRPRNLDRQAFVEFFKHKLPTFRGEPPQLPSNAELMNIIVFIRNWKKKFSYYGKYDFHAANGETVQVEQMRAVLDTEAGRSPNLQATFVSIPYLDKRYRMVVMMPDKEVPMQQFVEKLAKDNALDMYLQRLHEKESYFKSIELIMPPFRIEANLELTSLLTNQLSGARLNMDHISPELSDLQSSQLSLIEVTKQGTFAQAVTRFTAKSLEFSQETITINRPFVYFVLGAVPHTANKHEVLFAGYVNNPSK